MGVFSIVKPATIDSCIRPRLSILYADPPPNFLPAVVLGPDLCPRIYPEFDFGKLQVINTTYVTTFAQRVATLSLDADS
jgi:hypothetical protein